jgi:ATP-dependent protease ClpP protease subunit
MSAEEAKSYGIVDHVISHRGELVEPTKQPSMTL